MAERKRGYAIKDSNARRENIELAPYPSWANWKHILITYLNQKGFKTELGEAESLLHEWYVARRLYQAGKTEKDEFSKYRAEFNRQHGEILDDPLINKAFSFVTAKTEPNHKS